jgi:hypothetical protein
MARQYLQDGGPLEPAITDPKAASAVTTAEGAWNSLRYTLIPAYDPRPGKVYVIEAGGLITTAATGALTLAPSISTTNAAGTTLGSSIAQTVPGVLAVGPVVSAARAGRVDDGRSGRHELDDQGHGVLPVRRRRGDRNSGLDLTFGGTSAAFDHSVNQSIFLNKTLSVAGSWTTQWCYADRRSN